MSNIIKIILGFCIFFTVVILIGSAIGCGEVEEEPSYITVHQLDSILKARDIDTLQLQPAALKVIPGRDWVKDPKDTIAKYGFKGLNQDFENGRESIIVSDTLLAWLRDSIGGTQTLTYSNDSLTISGGNTVVITGFADSLSTITILNALADYTENTLYPDIVANADSLAVHRVVLNWLSDSLAVHRTDINSINSGLPANAAIVYILSGQSNADGRALNSDATAGELDASSTIQIWNRYKKVFEPLNISAGNNEGDNAHPNKHGIELGLSENLDHEVYLIKHGVGGTAISGWVTNPSAQRDTLFNLMIRPAIDVLIEQGKIPYVTFLWHQGETDAVSDANTYGYLPKLDFLRDSLNTLLRGNVPFVAGTINQNTARDRRINDCFRYLHGENFFRVAELDWQASNRVDALHLNYDGWKAGSLKYLEQIDSLTPLRVDKRIAPRKFINITSVSASVCEDDEYELTVNVAYQNLVDSIIVNVAGVEYGFWQTAFNGTGTLLVEGLECGSDTDLPVYAYFKNDTIISDYDTYDESASGLLLQYDFAAYEPPTEDATKFIDITGAGHEIAVINSDTMIHNKSGEVTTVNPHFMLAEVPLSTGDIAIDFTLYAASTNVRGLVTLKADTTGVLVAIGHMVNIRCDQGDVIFYYTNGNGSYTGKGATTALPGGAYTAGEERKYRLTEVGNVMTLSEWTGAAYTEVKTWTFTTHALAAGGVMFGAFDQTYLEENAYYDDIIVTIE